VTHIQMQSSIQII